MSWAKTKVRWHDVIVVLILLLVIGESLLSNSKLENTRTEEIVQLVAFGMLLGTLVVNLIAGYRKQ